MAKKTLNVRTILLNGGKLVGALLIVLWLIKTGRFDPKVYQTLYSSHGVGSLVGVALAQLIAISLVILRWWFLVRVHGIPVPFSQVMRTGNQGNFANLLVPGGIGIEGIRLAYLHRYHRGNLSLGLASVAMDKMLGLLGLLILSTFGGSIYFTLYRTPWLGTLLLMEFLVLLGFALLILSGLAILPFHEVLGWKRYRVFARASSALYSYRTHYGSLLFAVLLSISAHLATCIAAWFAMSALQVNASLLTMFWVVPILMVLRSIPLTPMGLGVLDGAAEEIFGSIGISGGAEMQMMMRAIMVMLGLVSGGLAFVWKPPDRPSLSPANDDSSP